MRPLRVAHALHVYAPVIGGSQLIFQRIGEGLAKRGVEVTVITSTARAADDLLNGGQPLAAGREHHDGVVVERLPHRRLSWLEQRSLAAATHLWSSRRWTGYGYLKAMKVGPHVRGLGRALAACAPDVIATTAAPCLTVFDADHAAAKLGTPFAIMPCLHSDHAWFMDNPALIDLLRRADAVMTLTPYEGQLLQALDVDPSRLSPIGGGVALDDVRLAETGLREAHGISATDRLVLFLGRQEDAKGIVPLVDAMAARWREGATDALAIVGAATAFSGTVLREKLVALPAEHRRRITIRETVTEREKWGWYSTCDVFAHPARHESFGLVYLEAWAAAKPVIGGRTGPQSCVITDGVDGLLVFPGDVDELKRALDRLLSDSTRAAAMGRAGRDKVVESFTWDSVVTRAERLYRALADRTARATD